MKNDINVKKRAAVLTVIVVILVAVCVGAIAHMKSSGRDGSLMAYVYKLLFVLRRNGRNRN